MFQAVLPHTVLLEWVAKAKLCGISASVGSSILTENKAPSNLS